MRWSPWTLLFLLLLGSVVQAHEVRPAYLQFTEEGPGVFAVLWKQPVLDGRRLPLEPIYPEACQSLAPATQRRTAGALLRNERLACDLRAGTVGVDGLAQTLTDVLVAIDYADGTATRFILKPEYPTQDLAAPTPGLRSYLVIGIEHLLFGIDHILFVIALVLLIRSPRMLLLTITAFTLAHSLTLALSVLDLVRVPQAPVEAIIALSIVFLARELLRDPTAPPSLASQRPWLVAGAFGLLHGLGFAGALADIGLPQGQLAPALLLFNLGLEIGQLLVVAGMLALGALAGRWVAPGWLRRVEGGPAINAASVLALGLGTVATYWTIDRLLLIV
ncbi:MAG: HupE/UreJ family protein [Pseudomonadota bacterium]